MINRFVRSSALLAVVTLATLVGCSKSSGSSLPPAPTVDVTGDWEMTFVVDSSSCDEDAEPEETVSGVDMLQDGFTVTITLDGEEPVNASISSNVITLTDIDREEFDDGEFLEIRIDLRMEVTEDSNSLTGSGTLRTTGVFFGEPIDCTAPVTVTGIRIS